MQEMKQRPFSRSLTLFFALKLHRNACYAGYNIPSLISSLICIHSIIYLVFTVTLWLCLPSAESIYDPPRRTNFASFPWSLNSSDTHSHAFPNMSYIPNNKIQNTVRNTVSFNAGSRGRAWGAHASPFFLYQTEARKKFFLRPPPPYLRVGWPPPPPPHLKVWIRHWVWRVPWNQPMKQDPQNSIWDHIKPTHISRGECTPVLKQWKWSKEFLGLKFSILGFWRGGVGKF